MRRQTVTRQQVFDTADQIVDMGLNPTQNAIIRRVGGSYGTIGKFMDEWRRERRAANENPAVEAPDKLLGSAKTFAEEMWKTAVDLATARLHDERGRLDLERATLDDDRADLAALLHGMEEAAAAQEARIANLELSLRNGETVAAMLRENLAAASERASIAEIMRTETDRRIQDLEERLTRENQRNAELIASLLSLRQGKRESHRRRVHSKG